MPTTTKNLIDQTKAHLYRGFREQLNQLAADAASGATSLSFVYDLGGIAPGARVSVGLEDYHVWDATPSTKTATVQPGMYGSTTSAHSKNDIVVVNPKFSDQEILQAINDDLIDLCAPSNGLFQVKTATLTFNPSNSGYDLTGVTNVDGIIEVKWKQLGSSRNWPTLRAWAVKRNLPTTDFASGKALFVYDYIDPGVSIVVSYKAPFGTLAALTDDVATTGLPTTATDLPPLGAAIRLTAGREVHRNFDEVQGETRRAEQVPPGANLHSADALRQLRKERIIAEAERLSQQYPIRTPI